MAKYNLGQIIHSAKVTCPANVPTHSHVHRTVSNHPARDIFLKRPIIKSQNDGTREKKKTVYTLFGTFENPVICHVQKTSSKFTY